MENSCAAPIRQGERLPLPQLEDRVAEQRKLRDDLSEIESGVQSLERVAFDDARGDLALACPVIADGLGDGVQKLRHMVQEHRLRQLARRGQPSNRLLPKSQNLALPRKDELPQRRAALFDLLRLPGIHTPPGTAYPISGYFL